jgi:hypothetical protein
MIQLKRKRKEKENLQELRTMTAPTLASGLPLDKKTRERYLFSIFSPLD